MNKILFVCLENACRSQMAEAFFNRFAKEMNLDWRAESAGTSPAKRINPEIIEVMDEIGLDLTNAKPKLIDLNNINDYAIIISFGCLAKNTFNKDIQAKIEEWRINDAHRKKMNEIRIIRDEIKSRLIDLIDKLKVTA